MSFDMLLLLLTYIPNLLFWIAVQSQLNLFFAAPLFITSQPNSMYTACVDEPLNL